MKLENMVNWSYTTIASNLTLHKGINTIYIKSTDVNTTYRLPNIDAFAIQVLETK